jgi:hypothetical protein
MHVSLVFGLASRFAETRLCFRPLPLARRVAGRTLDPVAMSAVGLGVRQGRGTSIFSSLENTPL